MTRMNEDGTRTFVASQREVDGALVTIRERGLDVKAAPSATDHSFHLFWKRSGYRERLSRRDVYMLARGIRLGETYPKV